MARIPCEIHRSLSFRLPACFLGSPSIRYQRGDGKYILAPRLSCALHMHTSEA